MAFTVGCHGCGEILYEGRDMIPFYRLRAKCDNKCPACGRKLAINPLSIILEPIEEQAEKVKADYEINQNADYHLESDK
jgi:predicted methyltransferase